MRRMWIMQQGCDEVCRQGRVTDRGEDDAGGTESWTGSVKNRTKTEASGCTADWPAARAPGAVQDEGNRRRGCRLRNRCRLRRRRRRACGGRRRPIAIFLVATLLGRARGGDAVQELFLRHEPKEGSDGEVDGTERNQTHRILRRVVDKHGDRRLGLRR